MKVLITGAAGNLGSLLARHIIQRKRGLRLVLMQHRRPVPADLRSSSLVEVRQADLSRPETLPECLMDADVIVHFAGVLFQARPEKFLPRTNTHYFKNLVDAACRHGIHKVILISFPHVEGPTSRKSPATGRLDGNPVSVHAGTRLEEERYLFKRVNNPVCLRAGMVYGKGILMIDAALWLARYHLLGVWREPTDIHLVSKIDFCRAVTATLESNRAKGIYHIGDEGHDTLQSFLDYICDHSGYRRPWRMPLGFIYAAAALAETFSGIFHISSPLTRDFIDIGRVPYYGDTSRFRGELLPDLVYPDLLSGWRELMP